MGKQSGRRSLADLNAAQFSVAIQPTRTLSEAEMDVWCRATESWPSSHWVRSDADLLTQYCSVCALMEKARKSGEIDRMEKLGRLVLSYATRLRMTPQSRYDGRATARDAEHGRETDAASSERLLGDAWVGVAN
jgi:hypothetical protein